MTFSEIPFLEFEKSLVHRDFQSSDTLAWEAVVLPIYESCNCTGIIADGNGNFNHYLSEDFYLWKRRRCGILKEKTQEDKRMKEYELVREIPNLCRNNQMRDVFFDEVETDDPVQYVKDFLQGKAVEISADRKDGGAVTVYAVCDGLQQKFVFTPI